jgi:hypothetical protein
VRTFKVLRFWVLGFLGSQALAVGAERSEATATATATNMRAAALR